MARPFLWPSAPAPTPRTGAAAPVPLVAQSPIAMPPGPLDGLDGAAFAAVLGPLLARGLGSRVMVHRSEEAEAVDERPVPDPASQAGLLIGRITLAGGAIDVRIAEAGAAWLIERLFGSRPEAGSGSKSAEAAQAPLHAPDAKSSAVAMAALSRLPPGSGSWLVLTNCLAEAVIAALADVGMPSKGVPTLTPRPVAGAVLDGQTLARFTLALDGRRFDLALVADAPAVPKDRAAPPESIAPPGPTPAEIKVWRRRATDMTLDVDLPVTIRLADCPMPVARLAGLQPGDILPIDLPHALTVMVGGQPFAQLPGPGNRHPLRHAAAAPARQRSDRRPSRAEVNL